MLMVASLWYTRNKRTGLHTWKKIAECMMHFASFAPKSVYSSGPGQTASDVTTTYYVQKKLLERANETTITPITSSDHRFLGIKFDLGKDPIADPGIWRHNDKLLNDDDTLHQKRKRV